MSSTNKATGRLSWALVLLISGIAASLRLYLLAEVPGGFYCDEAANGYNAYNLFQHGVDEHGRRYPLFVWSFLAFKYPLYVYPTALWTGLFGLDEFTTRLQAALYGIATIPVAFLVARQLAGNAAGVAAAACLAVIPWHHHFSRVAFSLIGLPFWFGLGLYFLLRCLSPTGQRRDWILAGVFLALTPYSYTPAQVMLPPFLAIVFLLHIDIVWKNRLSALFGLLAFAIVVGPFVHFFWTTLDQQTKYASMISVFTDNRTTEESLQLAGNNWLQYYSEAFLFTHGDPVLRHSARGFGMLYEAMAPWIGLGLVGSLLTWNRRPKIILIWLLLYPVAAALVRETPAATRSITGALLFPISAGLGVGYAYHGLRRLLGTNAAGIAVTVACAATLQVMAPNTLRYFEHYFKEYPKYTAFGLYGFQHGWREMFAYLEQNRSRVEAIRISLTDVNQPYIFRLFYLNRTPEEIRQWGTPQQDYKFVQVKEIDRWYRPDQQLLFAVHQLDLYMFDTWDERHDIIAPGDHLSFAILRNPVPKTFFDKWRVTKPFPNPQNANRTQEYIDPLSASSGAAEDPSAEWADVPSPNGNINLNLFQGQRLDPPVRNAEFQIAYLRKTITQEEAREGVLEIYGSSDEVVVWVNGNRLVQDRTVAMPNKALELPVQLETGANTILIKSIETVGGWWVAARIR